MRSLIVGYWSSQLVFMAAKLGLADLLAKGPKTSAALAQEAGVQPAPLDRALRALAGVGVFQAMKDGRFKNTTLSDTLRTGTPQSMRPFALMMVDDYNWMSWAALTHGVRSASVPFQDTHGLEVFEYFERHPDKAKTFGEAMTSISGVENPAVANAYDFSRIRKLVDVGGSHGHLLAEILRKNRKLRGVLFDQPSVIERARAAEHVSSKDVRDRIELVAGSFFEGVPEGADAYIMKYILHDWNDDVCVEILSHCRGAMAPGGRVLVVDSVIAPGNDPAWGKLLDINMLVITGGRERTAKEFADLFKRAGLKLRKVYPTACDLGIVEGVAD